MDNGELFSDEPIFGVTKGTTMASFENIPKTEETTEYRGFTIGKETDGKFFVFTKHGAMFFPDLKEAKGWIDFIKKWEG